MADIRVKDLDEAATPGVDYFLLTDSATDGVKKIKPANTVTRASLSIDNVDNTADLDKPISTATQTALDDKADASSLATVATSGAYGDLTGKPTLGSAATLNVGLGPNNIPQLDGSGRMPAIDGSQLTGLAGGGDMVASVYDLNGVHADAFDLANIAAFTRTDALTKSLPAVQTAFQTSGYLTTGDGGGGTYKRVVSAPSHDAKVQTADGAWWELVPTGGRLMSRQLGLHDAATAADCTTAFQGFVDAAVALKATAKVNPGDTYTFPSGSVDLPEGIDLDLTGATLVRSVDVIVPLLQCVGADANNRVGNGRIRGGTLSYTASTTTNTITNSAAIWLKFCHDWRVNDVSITGPFYIGFRFEDCLDTTLDGFAVRGVYNRALYVCAAVYTENVHCVNGLCDGYAPGTATRVTNHIINTNAFGTGTGRNVTFTNIVSRNGTTSPTGEGFAFSERIFAQKAVNCRAVNCPIGFNIQKANSQANQNTQLVNCEADTCDRGFIGTDSFYIVLTGCRSISHSAAGFEFTNCVGVIITGCLANGTGLTAGTCYGFSLKGTSSGVTYNGCIAYNNGVSGTAGSGTAFYAEATCSNIVGRGNFAALNGTKINFNGASSTDFPITSGSGNLFP